MLQARLGVGAINALKKNAVKDDSYMVGVVEGVAYTLDWMSVGVCVLNKCGTGNDVDGNIAFEINKFDFADITKGVKGELEFILGEEGNPEYVGHYTCNGYKYNVGINLTCPADAFADIIGVKKGFSLYKGKLNLPTRDEVIGLVGIGEAKTSLNHLCWNTQNGCLYSTDTKAMLKHQCLPQLDIGNEFLLLPPKVLNYLTQDECEIFKGDDYVIITQGDISVYIHLDKNAIDKPPLFDAVIPQGRNIRGNLAINKKYLLGILKNARNGKALLRLDEGGLVKLTDYNSLDKEGVDIPLNSDYILHNASELYGDKDTLCVDIKRFSNLLKYGRDEYIICDIPAKVPGSYKTADGEEVDSTEYPFQSQCLVAKTDGATMLLTPTIR